MARRSALLSLIALLGCTGPPQPAQQHDDPSLPRYPGERVDVRSDAPVEWLPTIVHRLDAFEAMLDAAFPFLVVEGPKPLTLVLDDPGRFALATREHGFDGEGAAAVVCEQGELILRFHPEDWTQDWVGGPPFPLEPRVRPQAAATLSRRLVRRWGELEPTWLEVGLQAVFVDLAAQETGEQALALQARRERLLDAYLPLYLGAPPALVEMVRDPRRSRARTGARALAWAAVGFLLSDPQRTAWLGLALRRAAGAPVDDAAWSEALAGLAALEAEFEAYLRGALLRELLATFLEAPTPVDRWEAAAALRLVANLDIDADADEALRQRLVGATARLLDEEPLPPRFLDEFAADLARVRTARSRIQAQRRLAHRVRAEFERRAAGYGHPAVEAARQDLGQALRRALAAATEAE